MLWHSVSQQSAEATLEALHSFQHVAFACTGIPELALSFKVSRKGVVLMEPRWPRLSSLRERTMSATGMLFELMHKGVYLTPQPRDAELVPGLTVKVSLTLVS